MKPLRNTIALAAGLFAVDAFVLNQGAVALLVILVVLLVLLPRALWALRKDRGLYLQRLTKAGIYLLACVAVFVANAVQNRMADRRAIELGNACLAYHAKYQRYPNRLDELVPEFLPSVPLAKYSLGGSAVFFYASRPDGREPMLFYEAIPPFGRRFYHMETGRWGFLD
jgi:hypothetical protein